MVRASPRRRGRGQWILLVSCVMAHVYRSQGAAALINSSTYLEAAAGILAVEAYHAGSIREQLIQNGSYVVEAYNVTVDTIVDVSLKRATVQSFLVGKGLMTVVSVCHSCLGNPIRQASLARDEEAQQAAPAASGHVASFCALSISTRVCPITPGLPMPLRGHAPDS